MKKIPQDLKVQETSLMQIS